MGVRFILMEIDTSAAPEHFYKDTDWPRHAKENMAGNRRKIRTADVTDMDRNDGVSGAELVEWMKDRLA